MRREHAAKCATLNHIQKPFHTCAAVRSHGHGSLRAKRPPATEQITYTTTSQKAIALCENTGKFPQKHSAKCVKNARRRTAKKLQVASSAPLLLLATFQGEKYARYARRTQKILKSVMRLSIQSENKRKITLTPKTIKSAIRTSNIARTTII